MPGGPNDNRLYNQYKILVSEPKQVYYLNANSRGVLPSSSKDHDTWKIDYTAKLKIKGGAMVDVANEDLPSGMNANFLNIKVDGVPPDLLMQEPSGFPGQFFYLEVDCGALVPRSGPRSKDGSSEHEREVDLDDAVLARLHRVVDALGVGDAPGAASGCRA